MMAPVYAIDTGWLPLPPLVDVAQKVTELLQNFSFWSSCDAEWQYLGESGIPVLGSIAVDEGSLCPTLRRDQRTVLPASLAAGNAPAAVFSKDSNSENLGNFVYWNFSSIVCMITHDFIYAASNKKDTSGIVDRKCICYERRSKFDPLCATYKPEVFLTNSIVVQFYNC